MTIRVRIVQATGFFLTLSIPVAAAILGVYGGLIGFFSLKSAFTKKAPKEEPKPVVAATTDAGAIPDIESPEFATFLDNLSDEKLNLMIEKLG